MNKGQLIPAVLGMGFLIWMLRAPSQALAALGPQFLALLDRHEIIGYVFSCVFFFGWVIHVKFIKGTMEAESSRIGKEKTQLQERVAGKPLQSSRR